jgi:uncharacterized membrane protein
MDFGASNLSAGHPGIVFWLCVAAFVPALLTAPWRSLLARNELQHVFLATVLLLPLLWLMRFEVPGGVQLHLLGMTTITLLFGWQLALVLGGLAGLVLLALGTWSAALLPLNLLLTVLVPTLVTVTLLGAVNRLRRTNLFVYLLGLGFAGGSLSLFVAMQLGGWLMGPDFDHAITLLLIFPEGFLNGTLVTALAIFYPRIMRTYDEARYLDEH